MTPPLGGSTGLVYSRLLESIEPRPLTSRRRTGRAFFVDTFEHYTAVITEKWRADAVGGTIELSSVQPKTGLQCARLTTGALDTNTARIRLTMGAFPKGKFGMEVNLRVLEALTNIEYIHLSIRYYDGAAFHLAILNYLGEANRLWQYWNAAGAYVNIVGGAYDLSAAGDPCYNHIKAIIDFEDDHYVRLIYNELELDLSALTFEEGVSLEPPKIVFDVQLQTGENAAKTIYVDDVILTDQEP